VAHWAAAAAHATPSTFSALERVPMSDSDRPEGWPTSTLKAAEMTFIWLTIGPKPLALDCVALTDAGVAAAGASGAGCLGIAAVAAGHAGSFDSAAPSALPRCRTAAAGSAELPCRSAGGGRGGTTGETGGSLDSAGPPARRTCRTAERHCRKCRTADITGSAGLPHGSAGAGRAGINAEVAGVSAPSGDRLDLPVGEVPLPELRDWLVAHPNASVVRDAVWRELIRRARRGKPEWVIAAVGMAVPALVTMAGTFAVGYRGDPVDIDSAVLTGFLEALRHRVDPDRAALHFAAWRAGRNLCRAQQEFLPGR
jgi:hypothetical protein